MASSSGRGPSANNGTRFPWKPALAAGSVFVLLFLWHKFKDPATGLYPGIFADAFKVQLRQKSTQMGSGSKTLQPHAANQPDARPGTTTAANGTNGNGRQPISSFLIDDTGALDLFFASLHDLEAGKPGVVTVLHYGDSPTTADLITGDVRALLQKRFGDAGHGFNLIAKPWAWYGHRDVSISDHGWKSLTAVGSMRQAVYGVGGARFEGDKDARSTFKLADAAQTDMELQFFTEPSGSSVTITADGAPVQTIETHGDANIPTSKVIHLPANTKEVGVTANGPVTLAGIDFRRGDRGVLYDSLGLNGASTTVLSRAFDPNLWAAELQHAAPALVVINYGTNESSFGAFVDKQYEGELRLAIARVRKALPDVPILIMSPMDRGERSGLNEIRTMDTIPRVIAIQQRVAADLHCAFFDTFDAMGGDGTMSNWYTAKPRLVSADLIHPTPQGALIVAQELTENLYLGYARWQKQQGMTPSQTVAAAEPCRPVAIAKAPTLAPPGTVAAPVEPLPGTSPAPPASGAQAHPLPPCPPKGPPATKPAAAAKPSVSGDTEDNDSSNARKNSPGSPSHP